MQCDAVPLGSNINKSKGEEDKYFGEKNVVI